MTRTTMVELLKSRKGFPLCLWSATKVQPLAKLSGRFVNGVWGVKVLVVSGLLDGRLNYAFCIHAEDGGEIF